MQIITNSLTVEKKKISFFPAASTWLLYFHTKFYYLLSFENDDATN